MSDTPPDAQPKKDGKKKLIIGAVALLALIGGGVGAGVYAAQSGMVGGGHAAKAEEADKPKLVPKGEQKHAAKDEEEGGHGGGEADGDAPAASSAPSCCSSPSWSPRPGST